MLIPNVDTTWWLCLTRSLAPSDRSKGQTRLLSSTARLRDSWAMTDVERAIEETQDNETQIKSRSRPRKEFSGVRDYGKSILPVSRVQKILKADKVRAYLLFSLRFLTFLTGASYGYERSCICPFCFRGTYE